MKMKYVWIDLLVVFAIVNVYAFVAGDLAGEAEAWESK